MEMDVPRLVPLWRALQQLTLSDALERGLVKTDGDQQKWGEAKLRLALGGSRSGLIFHYHRAALNALFAGRKRWFVFDSGDREMPRSLVMRSKQGVPYTMSEWIELVYPREELQAKWKLRGWECTQEPGDLLYVPNNFIHGVLNLGETVAVAVTS